MSNLKNENKRWINTSTVWEWDGEQYVEVQNEGYWYEGPVAQAGQATTVVDAWRFYASDNSTAEEAQDTTTNLQPTTTYVCRVRIYNSGDKDEDATSFQLTYDYNSGTATGSVTGTSSYVQTADASGLTNGTAVTAGTLTGAAGSFINGEEVEDGTPANITLTAGNYTELWYAFTIVDADVNNNDTILLKFSTPDTSTGWPTITVKKPIGGTGTFTDTTQTLTGTGYAIRSATSTFTDTTQTLSGTGALVKPGSASFTDTTQSLTGSGTHIYGGTATFTDTANSLTSSPNNIWGGIGAFTVVASTLNGNGATYHAATATFSDTTQLLIGNGYSIRQGTATFTDTTNTLTSLGEYKYNIDNFSYYVNLPDGYQALKVNLPAGQLGFYVEN